jgi:hypothetical protein
LSLTIGSGKLIAFSALPAAERRIAVYDLRHPTATEGRILFDETDVTALSPEKRGVGMCVSKLRALSASECARKHRVSAGQL